MPKKRGAATEKSPQDTRAWYDRYLRCCGSRKLDGIRRVHVRELHTRITEENGPAIANRVVQLLRRVFNWAIREELWHGRNPAENIDLNAEKERERFIEARDGRILQGIGHRDECGSSRNFRTSRSIGFIYIIQFTRSPK
jgi:hypothetical protein